MSNQATLEKISNVPNLKTDKRGDLVTYGPGHIFGKMVTNVRLKANETRQLLIGSSNSPVPPKGFSVELKPQKMPAGTLETQITTEGSTKRYDYVLNVTNRSDRTVSAQVWQM
jgi:hypothetical protein